MFQEPYLITAVTVVSNTPVRRLFFPFFISFQLQEENTLAIQFVISSLNPQSLLTILPMYVHLTDAIRATYMQYDAISWIDFLLT